MYLFSFLKYLVLIWIVQFKHYFTEIFISLSSNDIDHAHPFISLEILNLFHQIKRKTKWIPCCEAGFHIIEMKVWHGNREDNDINNHLQHLSYFHDLKHSDWYHTVRIIYFWVLYLIYRIRCQMHHYRQNNYRPTQKAEKYILL